MHPERVRRRALDLLATGRSINSVSHELGVSRAAVRDWRDRLLRGDPLIPAGVTGCLACDPLDRDVREAYAALFGYYLGDGCVSAVRTHFVLRVSCDARYPGIVEDVGIIIQTVHPAGRVQHVAAPGAVVVQNSWKHWPCLFPQHGPGRKHERTLGLQPWQWEIVSEHPSDFLRGLFHSDGCRSNNFATRLVGGERKRYDYPRWQFVNHSTEIRQWCCDALDLLDIPWRRSNAKTISVSTRAGVARLDELIGLKR